MLHSTALVPVAPSAPPPSVIEPLRISADAQAKLDAIEREATNPATEKAHCHDMRFLDRWHRAIFGEALSVPTPTGTVIEFITWALAPDPDIDAHLVAEGVKAKLGPAAIGTIQRRLASLSVAHKGQSSNPCRDQRVRDLLTKTRRALAAQGVRPRKMAAATKDVLERMLATCGDDLRGTRDRAVLLVGCASGGRRRSELAAMLVEDLQRVEGVGFTMTIRRSKTDQEGKGHTVPICGRAAEALDAWLATSGIKDGFLFRGIDVSGNLNPSIFPRSIARIVKCRAKRAGFDPANFGGHSLRSGFVTESARQGVPLLEAMDLSGHRSFEVARGYYRAGHVLQNPAGKLF